MKDKAPTNAAEYVERHRRNTRYEGYGLDTATVTPCPFCAAPDFQRWPIMSVDEAVAEEATCKECGRSAKAIVNRYSGGISAEFVQTGGPDQPDWLVPKMRRIDR